MRKSGFDILSTITGRFCWELITVVKGSCGEFAPRPPVDYSISRASALLQVAPSNNHESGIFIGWLRRVNQSVDN